MLVGPSELIYLAPSPREFLLCNQEETPFIMFIHALCSCREGKYMQAYPHKHILG